LMANQLDLQCESYRLFDENNQFAINDLLEQCASIIKQQGRLFLIINDPCQNPCGYSLSFQEWQQLLKGLENLTQYGYITLVNDIAYIDYAFDSKEAKRYLELFNNLSDKLCILIAFSASKTLTSYGMRLGALIPICKNEEDEKAIINACTRYARANWSNCNHGLMKAFVDLYQNHYEAYLKERDSYVKLLKERAEIFLNEAKQCNLEHYPYRDGFFVTIKIEDDKADAFLNKLMENDIYLVRVNKGIRVALCSIPKKKLEGLAFRIKEIKDRL